MTQCLLLMPRYLRNISMPFLLRITLKHLLLQWEVVKLHSLNTEMGTFCCSLIPDITIVLMWGVYMMWHFHVRDGYVTFFVIHSQTALTFYALLQNVVLHFSLIYLWLDLRCWIHLSALLPGLCLSCVATPLTICAPQVTWLWHTLCNPKGTQ